MLGKRVVCFLSVLILISLCIGIFSNFAESVTYLCVDKTIMTKTISEKCTSKDKKITLSNNSLITKSKIINTLPKNVNNKLNIIDKLNLWLLHPF